MDTLAYLDTKVKEAIPVMMEATVTLVRKEVEAILEMTKWPAKDSKEIREKKVYLASNLFKSLQKLLVVRPE